MKFLYKIFSGYDGFTPKRIPGRMLPGDLLRLSWGRYIDVVDVGQAVWIYFHGPHKFENGVYARGFVESIDPSNQTVFVKVREYQTVSPLTDPDTSARIAKIVAPKYRQVFVLPERTDITPGCHVNSTADTCAARHCDFCPLWSAFYSVDPNTYSKPAHLQSLLSDLVPAYWVIPTRCYLGRSASDAVKRTSELFYRFKTGEKELAFPLAYGIYRSLQRRGIERIECVTPIPLSPDKAAAGELHRTELLARELARLLGVPMVDALSLSGPISKRRMLNAGFGTAAFRSRYERLLNVDRRIAKYRKILLVDDVCTKGLTLGCTARQIRSVTRTSEIVAATAGQMILKPVVTDDAPLRG